MPKQAQKSQSPTAVVIGLGNFVGLQTVRILHEKKVPVLGIADTPKNPFSRTNACERVLFADTTGDAFIQTLIEIGPDFSQKAVLFPCSDVTVLAISRNRQTLDPFYHILLPAPDVVETLMDKTLFYPFAKEAGLAIPETFLLHSRQEAEQAAAALRYPATLKPPVKTREWMDGAGGAKAYKVNSSEELLALYDRCCAWADMLMVQEWIEGPETGLVSCNSYHDANAKPRVTFTARKLRQWPRQTGYSSLGEECRCPEVLEETLRLFAAVNYHGLGYLEMKHDVRTGKYIIIEPNIGRPTGRSAICEAGGVELLYTAYCDAAGWPLPENRVQQFIGAKWIYWLCDIKSAFAAWRQGELTLKEWAHSLRGKKRSAVFSWTDPAPFWLKLFSSTRKTLSRYFKKLWKR